MLIEKLGKNQMDTYKEQFLNLFSYCFGIDEETGLKIFEMQEKKEQDILFLLATEKEQLQSSVLVYDFDVNWFGKSISMGGIGCVASLPEVREHKQVKALMEESLKAMKKKGQLLSFLAPFSYKFYNRYGWRWASQKTAYRINLNDLGHIRAKGYNARPLNEEDLEALNSVYDTCYKHLVGPNKRNHNWWQLKLEENKGNKVHSYGFYKDDQLKAYMFYSIDGDCLKVKEWGYTNQNAKKKLLNYIFVHRAQVKFVEVVVPKKDNLLYMLENMYQEVKEKSDMMARVVDVEGLLQQYPIKGTENVFFTLKVDDPYAPWNNQTLYVEFANGEVNITPIDKNTADIQCSIQEFTQLMCGFASLKELIVLNPDISRKKELVSAIDTHLHQADVFITDPF